MKKHHIWRDCKELTLDVVFLNKKSLHRHMFINFDKSGKLFRRKDTCFFIRQNMWVFIYVIPYI